MKKLFLTALAALIVAAGAMAQEPAEAPKEEAKKEEAAPKEEKKKKGSGFLKKLGKVVESSTGLNVSKEALFVYPEIGKFKCSLVSCVGDPATNQVKVRIQITKLFGERTNPNRYPVLEWVKVSGTTSNLPLANKPYPTNCVNGYDLAPHRPVEFEFEPAQPIVVPAGTKSIDLMFPVGVDGETYKIEARDCAITWLAAE